MYRTQQRSDGLSILLTSMKDIFRCTSYQIHSEIISGIITDCGQPTSDHLLASTCRYRDDCHAARSIFSDMGQDDRCEIGSWLDTLCDRGLRFEIGDLVNAVMKSGDSRESVEVRHGLVLS